MSHTSLARRESQRGNGTLEALAVLVILTLPLLMFTVESTGITRARAVAAQAAQEAARSFATAENTASGTVRAQAVVHGATNDSALNASPPRITCSAHPCLSPGTHITVTVAISVPLVYFQHAVLIEQSASTTVDRFREARP
ncbi:hypothetical protein ACGUFB_03465 [Actinotignum schaalii]|uniref:hypothetical protein n=1 Tax=Actinotignum schaalii TaxID=59505 RepID=UPI00373F8861